MSTGTGEPRDAHRHDRLGNGKKHILLNAFDMSTVGHLSPGQWKVWPLVSEGSETVS